MPWRCPACATEISHRTAAEAMPRPGQHYRCHVCRLELVYDAEVNKMVVVPLPDEIPTKPSPAPVDANTVEPGKVSGAGPNVPCLPDIYWCVTSPSAS